MPDALLHDITARPASAGAPARRPRVLVITHVHPFPRHAGQHLRVHYTLRALRAEARLAVLTVAPPSEVAEVHARLAEECDEAIVLPARTTRGLAGAAWHAGARLHALATGLRPSNFLIGRGELSPARVAPYLDPRRVDVAVFEYWHAHRTARLARARGIPTVLDLHDLLFRCVEAAMPARGPVTQAWRDWRVTRYRRREEAAWRDYDTLVAINREEEEYVRAVVPTARVVHAPMGTDLARWPFRPHVRGPGRLAFYGGLAAERNQAEAMACVRDVMPRVWETAPATEFLIIGSNPPPAIRELAADPRVTITGFVDDPGALLASVHAVLCPWRGRFGFRSRLVEVLATGTPVIASDDAVAGMELHDGDGIFLADDAATMARRALALLDDPVLRARQGVAARAVAERGFALARTYGPLADAVVAAARR